MALRLFPCYMLGQIFPQEGCSIRNMSPMSLPQHTLLPVCKDTRWGIVLRATHSGVDSLPFQKLGDILPAASCALHWREQKLREGMEENPCILGDHFLLHERNCQHRFFSLKQEDKISSTQIWKLLLLYNAGSPKLESYRTPTFILTGLQWSETRTSPMGSSFLPKKVNVGSSQLVENILFSLILKLIVFPRLDLT